MLKKFKIIATIFMVISISSTAYASRNIVKEFSYINKINMQQVTTSCWADAIEMLLNTHGVDWSQDNVLEAAKGKINLEAVQVSEAAPFLNNWEFDYDGKKWSTSSKHYEGDLPEETLKNEIDNGRPLIVTVTESGRADVIIVYGYSQYTSDEGIDSLHYFDPHELRTKMIDAKTFKQFSKNFWTFNVTKQ